MVCATCTTSYETDTETASLPSSTSTLNQQNFRAPCTSNTTNETPTLPSTSNKKSVLSLPHSTAPMPSPPVHVPDFAPSATLPSLPPPTERPQLPAPPTHAPRLPHPTLIPLPMILPRPLPPSRPPVPFPKPSEQHLKMSISLHSFVKAMGKYIHHYKQQHRHYKIRSSNSSLPCKNKRWNWSPPFYKTNLPPQQQPPLLWYQPHPQQGKFNPFWRQLAKTNSPPPSQYQRSHILAEKLLIYC